MEIVEDVVIVGAGIAGLTTSLGLHRLGIRSLVLESSNKLRAVGFALSTWNNAWKALDAVGIGDSLRQQHLRINGTIVSSIESKKRTFESSFDNLEIRYVRRSKLLEALAKELPNDTIRLSSKVVCIEESGYYKILHLDDGTILKTKVLIGCDGINSVVAKWLGFQKPVLFGTMAIRAYAVFENGHGFGPKVRQFIGNGVRFLLLPCDERIVHWALTWKSSDLEKEALGENSANLKQFVTKKLEDTPHDEIKSVLEKTPADGLHLASIRTRRPWELLWANISKDNVCVAGDALHAMTPYVGQGGCLAMEEGVIMARCLAEALRKPADHGESNEEEEEFKRIEMGLKKFAKERRWRSFNLIATAYMAGIMQENNGKIISYARKLFYAFLPGLLARIAGFDCGKLDIS